MGLLTAGLLGLWTASSANRDVPYPTPREPPSLRPPPPQEPPFPKAIAVAPHTNTSTHILFLDPQATEASSSDNELPPPLSAWAAINTTFVAASATDTLDISIPPDTVQSLHRIQIFGLSPSCSPRPPQCICGPAAMHARLPAELRGTSPAPCPPVDCRRDVLQPLLLPGVRVYSQTDWFSLKLPCALAPGSTYTLEWLAAPDAAFLQSAPYATGVDGPAAVEAVALSAALIDFVPSTVAVGSDGGTTRVTVTAPAGLTVLSSAELVQETAEAHGAALPHT